ncbi:MAG: hypothetical protein ABS43_28360 [Bordetella sp. SCN 67-23]|nr:hypothetical protein [Burkholderiales bacterium]ODS68399.1 MAG: hypothetical protein ABS43_28360 [Bordetella sp. SCN 67-23]OJW93726.1 MAG: hypothetical protein BGO71_17645 [Burkholderiales bacterium 67-32]
MPRPASPPGTDFGIPRGDPARAAALAARCASFAPDDEDEWAADEARSCFNCRWRRWTPDSFRCLAPSPPT